MSNVVTLKISPVVAAFVRPGSTLESRMAACNSTITLEAVDKVMLLFCLSRDKDPTIYNAAFEAMALLPDSVIKEYSLSSGVHPAVLDTIAKACQERSTIRTFIAELPTIAPSTRDFLLHYEQAMRHSSDNVIAEHLCELSETVDEFAAEDCSAEQAEDLEANGHAVSDNEEFPEEEEYLSKYKMAQVMGTAEKIKMALSGDKEWRSILIKDSNKLISGSVIKNPRITEAEILSLLKAGVQNDEIMRLICANKEWVKSYQIRKALVENNRTPIQNAMRYLATLGEKDLANLAKSKNISSVISTAAKRLILNKKK